MSTVVLLLLILVAAVLLLAACLVANRFFNGEPDFLESVGVNGFYPHKCIPAAKIESYNELKERLRGQYGKEAGSNIKDRELWLSRLPSQAKDGLKYRLMQRAIGDMAALQRIDGDARGYWRLFAKGCISRKFWDSVVAAERELSLELESVKVEASRIEPMQDPQGIISEAMQFVVRYGDKLPSAADLAGSADAIADLMRHLPPPGSGGMPPLGGMPGMPGLPSGMPGMPGMPPGGMPPGGEMPPGMPPGMMPGGPQAPHGGVPGVAGGSGDSYKWKQDGDEIELSVSVPNNVTKSEVKVVIQAKSVKVLIRGEPLVEGALVGVCKPDGSTWTMSKGQVIVTLEKSNARPWPGLFIEPRADANSPIDHSATQQ